MKLHLFLIILLQAITTCVIAWVKEGIDLLLFIGPSQTLWHLALTRARLLQSIEFTYLTDSDFTSRTFREEAQRFLILYNLNSKTFVGDRVGQVTAKRIAGTRG
jgi:hypothetical protein